MLHECALLRRCSAGALPLAMLLVTGVAPAQTWSAARTTPSISELIAVDETGERAWPFGGEDVAGDGAMFGTAEQSVDVRTVYATTDAARLWVRAYVSAAAVPDSSMRLYVFIDADQDPLTGGSAAAGTIEPAFTSDPTNGGYDYVLGLSATGMVVGFWNYNPPLNDFMPNNGGAMRAEAEFGTDVDPLELGGRVHGYVGGSIELGPVAVTSTCDADLFLRAVSDVGNDLDIATRVRCIPGDRNDNGLPDDVEDVSACDADEDCPAAGRCISGRCRYTAVCGGDRTCGSGESCRNGRCVATGGGSCRSNADCDGLVCRNGTCATCDTAGAACESGRACGPDGRCVTGSPGGSDDDPAALVDPDEVVQGGAFTCGLGGERHGPVAWIVAGVGALALRRRRKRAR